MGLISCSSLLSPHSSQPNLSGQYHSALWEGDTTAIWNHLQQQSTRQLNQMQTTTTTASEHAWIQLALIAKQKKISTPQLASELMAWRAQYSAHPGNQLFPNNTTLMQLQSAARPRQIAILLPQNGPYASSGQSVREGLLNAYYASSVTNKQNVKFYDTTQTSSIRTLYQRALSEGADFVIGPLIKKDVKDLSQQGSFNTLTLGLNYTDNTLPTNFFEFGLLPEDEATQIANRAYQAGLSHAIIIAPQNAWGKRLVSAFSSRWQALGGDIKETWLYTSPVNFNQDIAHLLRVSAEADKALMENNNNKATLEHQRRQDFDVIFLFSQPAYARLIVPLLRYYYADHIPIYATSSVYSGNPDPTKDIDLNGVIICDIPRKQGESSNRLYAVGQDAYLLSQSLPRLIKIPAFPIYGSTGALVFSEQQKIHRRTPCRAIRNGLL